MKFKVGDKVILKECSDFTFVNSMKVYIGQEDTITSHHIGHKGKNYYNVKGNLWNWHESALELVESAEKQEYFYVGQTVYSPLFQNKERKAVITRIDKDMDYPVLCEGEGVWKEFTLDGKYRSNDYFVSLFQEPIQFPVNKPIETFEEGEIVEVSDDGENWYLCYYMGKSDDEMFPYRICVKKNSGKFGISLNYAKIRKINGKVD